MVVYSLKFVQLGSHLALAGRLTSQKSAAAAEQLRLAELKLNGVGFRGYSYRDRSILNVGYSHYVCLFSHQFHRVRRQRLILEQGLTEKFQQLKFPDPYRQRGIQNLRYKVKLKEGKKR